MLPMRFLLPLLLCIVLPGSWSPAVADEAASAWTLPPINRPDLGGTPRRLYDWRGRVLVVNFWASWCGPCLVEIPSLVRYQEKYGPRGLQIVGVGLDERDKLANVVRSLGINYPVLVAHPRRDLSLLLAWGDRRQTLPYSVVIARDGRIALRYAGVIDDMVMHDYVLPLLEEKGSAAGDGPDSKKAP